MVRYLLTLRITDILDIAIMAFVLYKICTLVQSTKAASLVKGLLVFLAALVLSSALQLNGINYIMSRMVKLGRAGADHPLPAGDPPDPGAGGQPPLYRLLHPRRSPPDAMEQAIGQTVLACTEMSQTRTGALIVFEREILLDDMVRSGTVLDAAVSSELLKNIFFVKAPMHDGAVIVRHGRVLGAGCMLPLSKNVNLSPGSGDAPPGRHRHERELRRGGGDRLRGDRLHLRGHRRDAQAASQAGDAGKPPAERAASAGGGPTDKPKFSLLASCRPEERRCRGCRVRIGSGNLLYLFWPLWWLRIWFYVDMSTATAPSASP